VTRIQWTAQATDGLQAAYDFVALDSAEQAALVVSRLVLAAEILDRFPWSGRRVPEHARNDVRELVRSPYRIVYRVTGEAIHILAVFRSWRLVPDEQKR
jgi:toxin ParE1/3/4